MTTITLRLRSLAAAEEKSAPTSTYSFGGHIKFNAMFSDYSDGDLAPGSAGTQFYIPATIPVGGADESSSVDLQGRESRINFRINHDLASGNLEAIDQSAGFIAYRHPWNSKWRSNFIASYLSNDNDTTLTGTGVTKDVQSFRVNLLYSPVPKMTVGGEISFAERTLESGGSGDMTRFYFAAKYVF